MENHSRLKIAFGIVFIRFFLYSNFFTQKISRCCYQTTAQKFVAFSWNLWNLLTINFSLQCDTNWKDKRKTRLLVCWNFNELLRCHLLANIQKSFCKREPALKLETFKFTQMLFLRQTYKNCSFKRSEIKVLFQWFQFGSIFLAKSRKSFRNKNF